MGNRQVDTIDESGRKIGSMPEALQQGLIVLNRSQLAPSAIGGLDWGGRYARLSHRLRLTLRPSELSRFPRRERGPHQREATMSSSGLPALSTREMGRPMLDWFDFVGSMPSARQTVASRSGTETGRCSMVSPPALVLPITCPPLMPPPPSTAVQARGNGRGPCRH